MDFAYWIWVLIAVQSGAVVGLCLVRADWKHLYHARNARVAGLGLICAAISWGSTARRDEELRPWLVVLLMGIMLCGYGMSRVAPGEDRAKELPGK